MPSTASHLILANAWQALADGAASVAAGLRWFVLNPFQPLEDGAPWYTPLADWRGFWLGQVLDDRLVVVYFLPLIPLLLLLRGNRLRIGLIAAGLMFVAYVMGLAYAGLWLLMALAFHRLAERFAVECRRTDVLPIGPPLAAAAIIVGWYIATMALGAAALPQWLNDWLWRHAPWLFPLGGRGLSWEPWLGHLRLDAANVEPYSDRPFPLVHAMFFNVHNIGTAYLAVRLLHYFSEIRQGGIPPERRTLLNFLTWTCYGPALIQGPIERFNTFQDEMDTCHLRRSWRNVPPAFARILMGVGKSLVGTLWFKWPILWGVFRIGERNIYWQRPEEIESFGLLYLGVFLQIFWLYLEFSGMCDIVVGLGWLFGYRQAENFARPWLATSLRDFWRRWHITLSAILRDYVYIPLGGNRRHTTFNLCVTFGLIGVWHALVPQVLIWGVLMGLMLAVNQRWAAWMKQLDQVGTGGSAGPDDRRGDRALPDGRHGGRPLQAFCAAVRRGARRLHPLPTLCSWLLTQHAFVFSLLIFFGGFGGLRVAWEIIRRALHLPVPPWNMLWQ
ncbi:MAG: MBOAT family O-acyltransferase [Planctomycetota bacterium]